MEKGLLFHIVKKDEWKRHKEGGNYIPKSIEQQGFIHCSNGKQINKTANRIFSSQRHLWLLIIDESRLNAEVKYEKDEETGETFPHIYGPLNTDAILDRISLNPDKKGNFNLEFSSD